MSTTLKRPVGSRVGVDHPDYPGVWTVLSNGPANAKLERESSPGRHLRCPHTLLVDPPVDGAPPVAAAVQYFVLGELVRVTGRYAGLYVVIADKGADKVNLALLGGDNDRYLRVHRRGVTKVDVASVLKEV